MLARARSWSWARVQPAFATPTIGTVSRPRRTRPWSAGKIFLYARSPVAPKKTRASEGVVSIGHPPSAGPRKVVAAGERREARANRREGAAAERGTDRMAAGERRGERGADPRVALEVDVLLPADGRAAAP